MANLELIKYNMFSYAPSIDGNNFTHEKCRLVCILKKIVELDVDI